MCCWCHKPLRTPCPTICWSARTATPSRLASIMSSWISTELLGCSSSMTAHQETSGLYTCLSNKGFSTVDYFLTTADQLEGVKRLEVNYDEKYSSHKDAHSDHRPLVLTITQQWQPPPVQQKAIKHLPRFKYDIAKAAEFSRSVQHNIGVWASLDVLDASDVQTTINLLQQCITQSVEEVFRNKQVALRKVVKQSHKP